MVPAEILCSFFAVILWISYLVISDYIGMRFLVFLEQMHAMLYEDGLPGSAAPIYFIALVTKAFQILGVVVGGWLGIQGSLQPAGPACCWPSRTPVLLEPSR